MTDETNYGIKLVFFRGTNYILLIYIKSFGIELKYSPLHRLSTGMRNILMRYS